MQKMGKIMQMKVIMRMVMLVSKSMEIMVEIMVCQILRQIPLYRMLHQLKMSKRDQSGIEDNPTYLQDYVSGEGLGLSDGEELHSLATVFCANEDPATYDEAKTYSTWRDAMKLEINAIKRNNTWELVVLPKGMKTIGVKWVFKMKYNEHGEVDKYKARLVAKGYAQ